MRLVREFAILVPLVGCGTRWFDDRGSVVMTFFVDVNCVYMNIQPDFPENRNIKRSIMRGAGEEPNYVKSGQYYSFERKF